MKDAELGADVLLERDEATIAAAVRAMLAVPVTGNEFSALVSFAFNNGPGKLRASTLLARLNAGDRQAAADEFPKWCWGGGRKLPGLIARRAAERALFLSPDLKEV